MMDLRARWERYKKDLCVVPSVGLSLDVSRMGFDDAFLASIDDRMKKAFEAMDAVEKGAIANPDEQRQVGHYWLRDADLAPHGEQRTLIMATISRIHSLVESVHYGRIRTAKRASFTDVLVIGIGGSALGPEFVSRALGETHEPMSIHFFDNTDPDGFDTVLGKIGERLATLLVLVISKSGGTKETRNGMLECKAAMEESGIKFEKQAIAITQEGSALDKIAVADEWLGRFPMWDWVGGRTSELSAVGLLPAALQGIDIDGMLEGARLADAATRVHDLRKNPSALIAASWYFAGDGRGAKDMVVLPYKDRLELFSRYLQQLVMESLGKEKDLDGKVVNQGIAVYGNKGSTDQHAYVQQLRDGVKNFFVTFIEVLQDRSPAATDRDVEPRVTSGDYLLGFLLGTRRALYESGRPSMTITLPDVSARSVGALIAVFERAVGFYGTLVNVNAYHQPGVEAGKKAAADVLEVQHKVIDALDRHKGDAPLDAEALAADAKVDDVETAFKILMHLSSQDRGVSRYTENGDGEAYAPHAVKFRAG